MLLALASLLSAAAAARETAPPWAAHVAAGDCAGALSLLPAAVLAAPTDAAAKLAQARCMEETGLDLQAVETAAGVTGALYPGRAWCRRARSWTSGSPRPRWTPSRG